MAETLRRAIRESGLSANALSKECGVKQTTLSGFLRGRDIRLSHAQRIASYLGLRLVKSKRSS